MSGEFRYDIRVLLCDACGGPFEVPVGGGVATCRFCRVTANLTPREEIDLTSPGSTEMDEVIRLGILTAQQEQPMRVQSNLAEKDPDLVLRRWKQAHTEIRRAYTTTLEDELFARCFDLVDYYAVNFELDRARAVAESTLEHVRSRRNIQNLRCWMARMALQDDDSTAATRWLQRCDPRSDDIDMDSNYRVSMARLSFAHGNFEGALSLLGTHYAEVPFRANVSPLAIFFRAHALERLRGANAGADELHRATRASGWSWKSLFQDYHLVVPTMASKSFALALDQLLPWHRWLTAAKILVVTGMLMGLGAFAPSESLFRALPTLGVALVVASLIPIAIAFVARRNLRARLRAALEARATLKQSYFASRMD